VTPFGGRQRALGTNPLAFSIPAGDRPSIVADFSTSATAEGRVRVYRHAGRPLPEGWLLDGDGHPTTDPEDLYAGGAILPAGEHKGFALSLMVEILGGVLAGAGCAFERGGPGQRGRLDGHRRGRFSRAGCLRERGWPRHRRSSVKCAGTRFNRVVMPGNPEASAKLSREASGIPVLEETWTSIVEAAKRLDLEVDESALIT
jgi:uncharacterized oxidoreductase